jgi:hypothetical protein
METEGIEEGTVDVAVEAIVVEDEVAVATEDVAARGEVVQRQAWPDWRLAYLKGRGIESRIRG